MTQAPEDKADEQLKWAVALRADPTGQRISYYAGPHHLRLELSGDGVMSSKEAATPNWDHGRIVNLPQPTIPVWRENDEGKTFEMVRQHLIEAGFPIAERHALFKGEVESTISVELSDGTRARLSISARLQRAVPAWKELCRRLNSQVKHMRSGQPTERVDNPHLHLWPDEVLKDRLPAETYAKYVARRRDKG